MTAASHAREADRLSDGEVPLPRGPLDLTPVEGSWISATSLAGGISLLRAREDQGSLLVEATGHDELRPGTWGEVTADGVFANSVRSAVGQAFVATFHGDQISSQVQAYEAFGVLTGHAFHRFTDGRRSYFSREFYVPDRDGTGRADQPAARHFPVALRTGGNAPGGLLGSWSGLAAATTGSIHALHCTDAGGGLAVRAEGVGRDGPVDWGTTDGQLFADAARPHDPPAFLATFNHGYMRVHLQARVNRGILVVCEFTEFTDGSGRSDYFIRECFASSGG
jgi:hypothetical protein